jgi:TPR repeat protein
LKAILLLGRSDVGFLKVIADSGKSVDAEFEMGMRYATGRGVARDPVAAAEYIGKAAAHGASGAAAVLAVIKYRAGDLTAVEKFDRRNAFGLGCYGYAMYVGGGEKTEEGVGCMKDAAEQGDPSAQNNYGAVLVTRNQAEAGIGFLRKAAGAGSETAMDNLGCIFENGIGVNGDQEAADDSVRVNQ